MSPWIQLGLFTAKTLIIFLAILFLLIAFFVLLAKSKDKLKGHLAINNIKDKYQDAAELISTEVLSKKELKAYLKDKKAENKKATKTKETPNLYVLDFHGDIQASAVTALREEITGILTVAKPTDEVLVRIESPGGTVSGYGLAAAQLLRLRSKRIPLTVAIDKVAASGGYMMACVADKILSSPFAIVGSIGVIVQLPNFHRLLKQNHIDFEQHTAGEFKRTISMFGENTDAGRHKLKEEIDDIQKQFTQLVSSHRPQIDIAKVATGEYWLGAHAKELNLVDEIKTSDEYLHERSKHANLYQLHYHMKKSLLKKLANGTSMIWQKLFGVVF